jgi:two-component system response regulator
MNRVDILLVEDNEDDVKLTLHALKKAVTKNVEVCRDGAEALDFLFGEGKFYDRDTTAQPRLVLLDLKLPKLDGFQVLERLKSDTRTRGIPVVMLTSSSRKTDADQCYQAGANSYLVKSVDFEQFTRDIAELGRYWLRLNRG